MESKGPDTDSHSNWVCPVKCGFIGFYCFSDDHLEEIIPHLREEISSCGFGGVVHQSKQNTLTVPDNIVLADCLTQNNLRQTENQSG